MKQIICEKCGFANFKEDIKCKKCGTYLVDDSSTAKTSGQSKGLFSKLKKNKN